jgi:NAD(P)-dependent dehydrogenase (short-subunit alcohol dehydrogenase family)
MSAGDLLDGRVAVVTGGGRGIGRAHCLELARHGAVVVVNDLDGDAAADTVAEIEVAGGAARADNTSVADFRAVARLVDGIVREHGHLDVVVNNAGLLRDAMIVTMTEADWDLVVSVHLKGTFALLKHACVYWRERSKAGQAVNGRVINTTSGAGLFGNVGQANYGPAKAAIASLTMIAAMENQRYGVTVNAISPLARTRMTAGLPAMTASADQPGWDRYDPSNSSPVVAWLASEASGWLNGAVLRVDGGLVRRMRPWSIDEETAYRSVSGERLDATELDRGMRVAFRILPGGLAANTRPPG